MPPETQGWRFSRASCCVSCLSRQASIDCGMVVAAPVQRHRVVAMGAALTEVDWVCRDQPRQQARRCSPRAVCILGMKR